MCNDVLKMRLYVATNVEYEPIIMSRRVLCASVYIMKSIASSDRRRQSLTSFLFLVTFYSNFVTLSFTLILCVLVTSIVSLSRQSISLSL